MAVSTIPVPFSTDWKEEVIATHTYGSLYGYINTKLKLACLCWAGNATAPTAGQTVYPVPIRFTPIREFVVPMKDNVAGGWLSINQEPKVRLTLTGKEWSNATLMYPLA